jgi:Tfp pilus assembly protein PilF
MVYAQIGRYGEAEQCLREALKINPAYANAHFNLAILGLKASKTDKPIKFADEMERGLQGAPGNMRARLMLAVYYEKSGLREDRLKAAAHYRILAERDSLHRAIFLERAALLDNR